MFANPTQRQAVELLDEVVALLERHPHIVGARELATEAERLMDGALVWLHATPNPESVHALLEEARALHRKATALVGG